MTEILKFDHVKDRTRSDYRRVGKSTPGCDRKNDTVVEEPFDFWPEVSFRRWITNSQPINPANSPARVFSEILSILGVTAVIAATISLFVTAPPLM